MADRDLDRFVADMPARADGDLMLCEDNGLAYQADRGHLIEYGSDYFDKCQSYEESDIASKLNAGRVRLVNSRLGGNRVVDIGIGSGEFIRNRRNTFGFDVNPVAVTWLKENGLWASRLNEYAGMTFWDVLEHVPDPGVYLDRVQLHGFVFASIPVFSDLARIRESRHYRPGEHLYYFTPDGFVGWMGLYGFTLLECSDFESAAGRDSVLSFAFKRIANPRRDVR